MATKKSSTLKTKTTRRAAKPAGGEKQRVEALRGVFHKLDDANNTLRLVRGAANVTELIGDETSDDFIQDALHSVSRFSQERLDSVREIIEAAMETIKTVQPPEPYPEAVARIAAEGAS